MQMNEAIEQLKALYDAIPSKEFKDKPIGYDKREVDEYLDGVCDVMLNVIEVAQDQQAQPVAAAKPAAQPVVKPAAAPAAAPAAPAADGSVQEVLSLAVRLKNDIISEAQAKAEGIVADAEKQAKERLGDLQNEQERLQSECDALKQTIADYKARFAALIEQQQQAMEAVKDI